MTTTLTVRLHPEHLTCPLRTFRMRWAPRLKVMLRCEVDIALAPMHENDDGEPEIDPDQPTLHVTCEGNWLLAYQACEMLRDAKEIAAIATNRSLRYHEVRAPKRRDASDAKVTSNILDSLLNDHVAWSEHHAQAIEDEALEPRNGWTKSGFMPPRPPRDVREHNDDAEYDVMNSWFRRRDAERERALRKAYQRHEM